MSSFYYSLFTFLITVSIVAKAAEPLSFMQCVELIKNYNAELKSSEENLQASLYQVNSIRGLYYPQISGNLSYSQSGPTTFSTSTAGTTYAATLNATQNIFNGFADTSRIDQAISQSQIAKATLQITKSKVSFDLKTAFANLIYAKETEKVAQDFAKRREDNLHMVELRFANGRENKGSLLLSQAYLQQALSDVLKAHHRYQTSQSDIKKTIGLDDPDEVDIRDDIPLNSPNITEPNYKNLIITIPNYSQLVAQVQIAEALLRNIKSGFYPTLNLTGSTGKYGEDFFPDNEHWSIGLNLSWPLFNGARDFNGTKSAAYSLYAAKSSLTSLEREQLSVLRKAFTTYVEAVEDLKVNNAFLQAAKSRAEIARAKYNNGLLTFDEWDIIENDLINRTKIYLTSKRDRIVAEAAWEQAQGIGVIP